MASANHLHWFWAKLGEETWPGRYHPVICHMIDVGQVAHALWRSAIRDHIRNRIANDLGLDIDAAGRWVAFWVAAHDIGKLTPCFQSQGKTQQLSERLRGEGFGGGLGNPHHTITGTKILAHALTAGSDGWPAIDRKVAEKIAVAVCGHHGTFPSGLDYRETDSLGNERWAIARCEQFGHLARLFGVGSTAPHAAAEDQSVWMLLAGLTAVADWVGSNETHFPRRGNSAEVDVPFNVDGYFTLAAERAGDALKQLGWLDRPDPAGVVAGFEKATGIGRPRPLQEEIVKLAESMTAPQLVIVEAPMGEGKTEAAWYVADCWDRRGGAGTYVALPTMATSNQMFTRVGKFLNGNGGKSNFMLLHGKAALNDRFEQLKYGARVYDEDGNPTGVVAEGWFAANKKHGLLAPFGVGTIDQALLAVLQTKHVFVRLFGLAGKCVILDEIHAYDAYMTTLMERLLCWLAALGCPVVLLSATLPADKRLKLLRAYAGNGTPEPEHKAYPRVTSVAVDGTPRVEHVAADEARKKTIHIGWVADGELVGKLKEALAGGGCAAVIRNTVGLAQETYVALRDGLKDAGIAVELFHARFPFGRRDEIEKSVLKRFGKEGGPAERDKRVLVATQVIEQSLDLDFDVMVTDVAPVDLVLQRAGRLHRHDRGKRGEPKLWLIETRKREQDSLPDFGPSEYVYARFVLLRSLVALRGRPTVALPDDLELLVEQIYGEEPLDTPEHYINDLATSREKLREKQREQNCAAKHVTIYRPDAEDLLEQPNMLLEEDDPDAHRKVQAATRDTEPTIQLILVYHRDGCDYLDVACTEPFDEDDTPGVARLRRLLDNEVTLSHPGCVRHYANQPVLAGWRKCGMLRHHRLVRLDQNGQAPAGEQILTSTSELGVKTEKKSAVG